MFKFLFVLLIIAILLAMIAVRFRKQINGLIAAARLLKDAKDAVQQAQLGRARTPLRTKTPVQLVNCSKCGVWVPGDKAVRHAGQVYCGRCA